MLSRIPWLTILSRIPWRPVKGLKSWIRRRLFRTDSSSPYQIVDAGEEKVRQVLARNHFATWNVLAQYFDHEKFGPEQLSMRRIESLDPDGRFWQTHIRGFEHPDGFAVCPHFELCPVEHPSGHLEKEGIEVKIAMKTTREIWEANGINVLEQSLE